MTREEILENLDSIHRKILSSSLAENITENEMLSFIECRQVFSMMIPKSPIRNDKCTCPHCGTHNEIIKKRRKTVSFDTVYCWHCGQAIEVKRSDVE
jgi:hypothetical protein